MSTYKDRADYVLRSIREGRPLEDTLRELDAPPTRLARLVYLDPANGRAFTVHHQDTIDPRLVRIGTVRERWGRWEFTTP